jgi:hypothetical protein
MTAGIARELVREVRGNCGGETPPYVVGRGDPRRCRTRRTVETLRQGHYIR